MTAFQWINVLILLVAITSECAWIYFNKSRWKVAIPMLLWLIHSLVFYAAIFLNPDPARVYLQFYNWSSMLRMQGYLTVLMMSLYRLNGGLLKWTGLQ